MKGSSRPLPDTDLGGVSAFSSKAALQTAYQRINSEIDWLEASIKAWKERHNSLNITSRLPPEILSVIFKYVTGVYHDADYLGMKWIRISHVCTHWRRVALECPSLWTTITIPSLHPSLAEKMLERSKVAPLAVEINVSTHNLRQQQLITMVLAGMSRIQELSFRHHQRHGDKMKEILAEFITSPAPLLETFNLSFRNHDERYVLPKHSFSGQSLRLHELKLQGCGPDWASPFLRGLTVLKVSYVAKSPVNEVLAALRNMPKLEVLSLCKVLSMASASAGPNAPSAPLVSLPRLSQVHIESEVRECASLLNYLTYPSSVSVSLNCTVSPRSVDSLDLSHSLPVIEGLGRVFSKAKPIRSLEVQYLSHPQVIRLTASDAPEKTDLPQLNLTLSSSPGMHYSNGCSRESVWAELLQTLWLSIPTNNLETLDIIQNSEFQDIWPSVFDGLAGATNLRRLAVVEDSGISFLRAFSPDTPVRQTAKSNRRVPLRISGLRELAIERWMLSQFADDGKCSELLKTCLKDRRRRRSAITQLSLTDCRNITDDDVVQLRDIVKNVAWDGHENFVAIAEEDNVDNSINNEDDPRTARIRVWLQRNGQ